MLLKTVKKTGQIIMEGHKAPCLKLKGVEKNLPQCNLKYKKLIINSVYKINSGQEEIKQKGRQSLQ